MFDVFISLYIQSFLLCINWISKEEAYDGINL
jgi:hypothetical protein